MADYRCGNCDWEGDYEDLMDDPNDEKDEEGNDLMLCPDCESADIEQTDSVGPNDYQSQTPLERPSE